MTGTTTTTYEPELGQLAFGQPSQAHACPDWLETYLVAIRDVLSETTGDRAFDSPFGNSGESFQNDVFSVEAYSWDDEYEQPWNFKYRDIEISWYKYLGRGMSINRIPTLAEGTQMLIDCLRSLVEDVP